MTPVRLDPENFKLNDFTAEVHVAVDKFLVALSAALADKYRQAHHSEASSLSANRGTSSNKAKISDAINKIYNNQKVCSPCFLVDMNQISCRDKPFNQIFYILLIFFLLWLLGGNLPILLFNLKAP